MTHAAMGGRCRESGHIEQRSATNGNHIGMPIDVETIDLGMNFGNVKIRILRPLTAFNRDWRANELEASAPCGEILLDLLAEFRLGDRKGFVNNHQSFNAIA